MRTAGLQARSSDRATPVALILLSATGVARSHESLAGLEARSPVNLNGTGSKDLVFSAPCGARASVASLPAALHAAGWMTFRHPASIMSTWPVISLEVGLTLLGQEPASLPSLSIRYLWKFHFGAAASPASPEIHW